MCRHETRQEHQRKARSDHSGKSGRRRGVISSSSDIGWNSSDESALLVHDMARAHEVVLVVPQPHSSQSLLMIILSEKMKMGILFPLPNIQGPPKLG